MYIALENRVDAVSVLATSLASCYTPVYANLPIGSLKARSALHCLYGRVYSLRGRHPCLRENSRHLSIVRRRLSHALDMSVRRDNADAYFSTLDIRDYRSSRASEGCHQFVRYRSRMRRIGVSEDRHQTRRVRCHNRSGRNRTGVVMGKAARSCEARASAPNALRSYRAISPYIRRVS